MLGFPRILLLSVLLFVANVNGKVPRVGHPGSRRAKNIASKRPSTTDARVSGSFTGSGWSATAPQVSAPYVNVWEELSDDEAASVISFLHNQTDLNLTAAADASRWVSDVSHLLVLIHNTSFSSWDNSIMRVEVLTPNKTDVLPFTDGNQSVPERWARAAIWVGATVDAYVIEYQVILALLYFNTIIVTLPACRSALFPSLIARS